MQITVRCPKCETEYRLSPEMRGQRMRCPNMQCKAVFEVKAIEDIPPPEAPRGRTAGPAAPIVEQTSGTVGDLVPILPAEAADEREPPPPNASEVADVPAAERTWQEPPPPRRMPPPFTPPPPRTPAAPVIRASESPPVPTPASLSTAEPVPTPLRPRAKKEPLPVRPKPEEPKPPAPPSWQDAPPPVRRGSASPSDTQQIAPVDTGTFPAAPPDSDEDALLRELGETPSVRGEDDVKSNEDAAPPRGSKLKRLMAGMVLLTACVIGGVVWIVLRTDANSEAERSRNGLAAYAHEENKKAASIFSSLIKDFPESDDRDTYTFLRDWSHLRSRLFDFGADRAEGLESLRAFVKSEEKNPIFAKYKDDVSKAYVILLDDQVEAAQKDLQPGAPDRIEAELEAAAPHVPANRLKALQTRLGEIRQAIAHKLLRDEVVKALKRLLENPVGDMLERAAEEIAQARRELPALLRDPEVQKLMGQLLDARRALVAWNEAVVPLERSAANGGEPALWVCTHLQGGEQAPPATGRVVFALARGVLYGLDQATGHVRWATRVGVDTTTLPVRIPANAAMPELVLVLSSDTNTLTVREARTGNPIWQHRLSAPCLGRPLVIGAKAYLPTYDGRVYEIDLAEGKQLGWFEVGKPLSAGGSRQDGTNLLYFPADERYVFVLDVVTRTCPAMLVSEHPAGSLRSEPVIISRADQRRDFHLPETEFPDYLVLSQASGLESMKLRVFPLPIKPGVGKAAVLGPEPEVPGWSWFPPFQNCERIVQVTDEGVIGLIGINQFRNHDKDLFLEMKYQIPSGKTDDRKGRAQVVHASEDDVWVLARGGLRLWHFDRFGQNLLPLWQQPLNLGSPLHAAQVDEGRAMVLVTQSPAEPICKATAVSPGADRDAGEIRWQKQLGLLCRGEPVLIGGQVFLLDQGCGLFRFDSKDHPGARGWEGAGHLVAAGLPRASNPRRRPPDRTWLLPSDDGLFLDLVALSPTGRLVVRRYEPGKKIENRSYGAFGQPTSAPTRTSKGLVLAMEDGMLLHLPSEGKGAGDTGPEWRARHADRDAPGFVAALGGDEFVSTDGSRGLTRWRWTGGRDFEKKTTSEDLPARIVAAPLVLPRTKDAILVCAADANGTLSIWKDSIAGGKHQAWRVEQSWPLTGRVTAGPFARDEQLGCILDRRRLVWIDPTKKDIAWEYDDGSQIIGTPQLVSGSLIVALQSGKFVALDPLTGKPRSAGYRLKANVAPVAAPVPFGNGRVLAPLSDGTLMILTLQQIGG